MDGPQSSSSASADTSAVCCSICLDPVIGRGSRSIVKLQCGDEFHLDCIGSAFNVKGAMQCPNCRSVERGQWLYASGSTGSFPVFTMHDWTPDDDPYWYSHSAMLLGVHWRPFNGLVQVHSSFEPIAPASANSNESDDELPEYIRPIAPASANSNESDDELPEWIRPIAPASANSNESDDELPEYNWNNLRRGRSFPVIDNQPRGHHAHTFSSNSGQINWTDHDSVTPATLRSTGAEYVPPLFHGHGNSQSNERTSASHANANASAIHHRHQSNNPPGIPPPIIPHVRRSNGPRGLAISQSGHSGGMSNFPPPGSSARNPHETDSSVWNRIHARERNHLSHPPVISFDRTSGWGPFHQAPGGSDSTDRSGSFWHGHRS